MKSKVNWRQLRQILNDGQLAFVVAAMDESTDPVAIAIAYPEEVQMIGEILIEEICINESNKTRTGTLSDFAKDAIGTLMREDPLAHQVLMQFLIPKDLSPDGHCHDSGIGKEAIKKLGIKLFYILLSRLDPLDSSWELIDFMEHQLLAMEEEKRSLIALLQEQKNKSLK